MPQSAFIVPVAEAEACVRELRARFDASLRLGVPAHFTVLMPFMSPERIDAAVLGQIRLALAEIPAFSFTLERVARFPAVAYLAPEPAAPFIALTTALVRGFPQFPPFSGQHASVIPHLTIAQGNATEAEIAASEAERWLQSHGPIRAACRSVTLLEDSSGRWNQMHVFELAQPSAEH